MTNLDWPARQAPAARAGRRIRVLIVDDSVIVRRILTEALSADPEIEVVGSAPDPFVARDRIIELRPDVLTLDIEMPRMDGLTFLRSLMAHHPLPVVVISSLAAPGCAAALDAVEAGAVEVLGKPSGPFSVGDLRLSIAQKVKAAAAARLVSHRAAPPKRIDRPAEACGRDCLIAIGASTGGTEAIRSVLEALPGAMPPIVVVQHIPAFFSRAFAERLNGLCALEVAEARHGDPVERGRVLIAPGDRHLLVRRRGTRWHAEVADGPRVCYQRPSVDVLFRSVAEAASDRAVGVLLTGMGSDGAKGLLEMRSHGAHTIAQDEASCVVYGMPREAARLGAAEKILPLDRVPAALCRLVA